MLAPVSGFRGASLVKGQQETTIVPMQTLYFMISSFADERGTSFATRIRNEIGKDDSVKTQV